MAQDLPAAPPYCGVPPVPDLLWSRWNADPVLIMGLTALALLYAIGAHRLANPPRSVTGGRQVAFYCGLAIAAAALISPLCALSVSLFAARVGQHMLLALAASPLIAAGRPLVVAAAVFRAPATPPVGRSWQSAPFAAAGTFAVLLWFWHAPALYALTFASTPAYWSMHVSVIAAAIWLWSGLLDQTPGGVLPAVGAGVISCTQMGLLGALITFAPRALYAPHALTTVAWGLTPLADQQLGGAIMWAPGGIVFLLAAIAGLRTLLAEDAWPAQPRAILPAKSV